MNEDDKKVTKPKEPRTRKTETVTSDSVTEVPKKRAARSKTTAKPTAKTVEKTPTKRAVTPKAVKPPAAKKETKVIKPRTKKLAAEATGESLENKSFEVEKTVSSKPAKTAVPIRKNRPAEIQTVSDAQLSPVFKKLAEPKLPALREDNRAFLQIQSPTRAYFYWSLKPNYFKSMGKVFGSRAGDYVLAIRLLNLNTSRDQFHQVESKGSWWFDVEANSKYQAEVGFYSPHRPFVRLVFSNILETPRLKPSANTAYQPYFAVTANQFADVLDMAGFSKDAFDVYITGDEPEIANQATEKAFLRIVEKPDFDFSEINVSELRFVLFALGSGVSLETLRGQISPKLFDFMASLAQQNVDSLSEEKVILALEEFFGISAFDEDGDSEITEEFALPTVFGASLINFPKGMNKQKSNFSPTKRSFEKGKLSPLSSFSLK